MRRFLGRLFGGDRLQGPAPVRETGKPPSPNGASSFHLHWDTAGSDPIAVRATLQVVDPPQTADLYFFALQASFATSERQLGGAHIGLQWNARHPGNTAANWGGYHSQDRGGGILEGTVSPLPSRPNDPNTRDYPWSAGRSYRLAISPGSSPGWWAGTVTDVASGRATVIRELNGGGDSLRSPVVWCEVFAPCHAPAVTVAWSELEYATTRGAWQAVASVRTAYQSYGAGGCTNTNSVAARGRLLQTTNTVRDTPPNRLLSIS